MDYEQPEEVVGGLARDFLGRNAARLRQHLGGLDHISRFVALAAIRQRREIRRVGLDQDALGRQRRGDVAQVLRILERQDAGERHVVT